MDQFFGAVARSYSRAAYIKPGTRGRIEMSQRAWTVPQSRNQYLGQPPCMQYCTAGMYERMKTDDCIFVCRDADRPRTNNIAINFEVYCNILYCNTGLPVGINK
jgi:hypothetical protein